MDQNTKTTWIYLSISLIAFILILVFGIYLRKSAGKKILANTGYTIGVFKNIGSTGRPSVSIAYFDFEINGKYWKNVQSKGKLIHSDNAKKENMYLVIYDTLNPENCQILFDYPIKDSTDFIRYLEEFKTKPLDFNKYF